MKSSSRSAGHTACSKNIQRKLTVQCLTLTAITAAEKLTFMLTFDGRMDWRKLELQCNTMFKEKATSCYKQVWQNSIDLMFIQSSSKNPQQNLAGLRAAASKLMLCLNGIGYRDFCTKWTHKILKTALRIVILFLLLYSSVFHSAIYKKYICMFIYEDNDACLGSLQWANTDNLVCVLLKGRKNFGQKFGNDIIQFWNKQTPSRNLI